MGIPSSNITFCVFFILAIFGLSSFIFVLFTLLFKFKLKNAKNVLGASNPRPQNNFLFFVFYLLLFDLF